MYISSIDNLIKNGEKRVTLTKFLTIEEQRQLALQNKVKVKFCNDYEDEIRKRAIVYPKNMHEDEVDDNFKIAYVQIDYDHKFGKLTHPQILGTIISLGLKREVIGDILVDEVVVIIVAAEIAQYIIDNLVLINNIGIKVSIIDQLPSNTKVNYREMKILVPSLRLDCVVSKSIKTSREKAKALIEAKMVRVNGIVNTSNDFILKPKDVISITKNGRIIINDVIGTSKKDKQIIRIFKTN